MSFQPVVPVGGLAGWRFLNRTLDTQTQAFDRSPALQRDTDYYADNIGDVKNAKELVADRRLLRVALGAFGLQEDLNNRFFIQKILEGSPSDDDALANRIADERYKALTAHFGFGDTEGSRVSSPGFATETIDRFRRQSFEVAVGDSEESLRLALNAERELNSIATGDGTDDAKWFRIMGTPPLRQVFETALGLPSSFSQIDLDQQLKVFQSRAASNLGISQVSDLSDPDIRNNLVDQFLLRDQLSSVSVMSAGSIALTLLQSAAR